jgi:hypothetical protein
MTKIKELRGFIYVVVFIFLITFATMYFGHNMTFMNFMMLSMGYFFLVFGLFKTANIDGFANIFSKYDLLARKSKIYAKSFPFIEVIIGLLYLFSVGGITRDFVTFVLMSVSSLGVHETLSGGDRPECACLGGVIKYPLTWATFFEKFLMAVMALYMIFSAISGGADHTSISGHMNQ